MANKTPTGIYNPENPDTDGDSSTALEPAERSQTAKEIADLQDKILKLANSRERLPQPLFWSLFNSRIRDIKKNKELDRLLSDVLG
jgi:hypothetical protein